MSNAMKRIAVINEILKRKKKVSTYLEIGVRNGKCFFSIKAKHRIAVDPNFRIGKRAYLKAYGMNPLRRLRDSFFEQTSDAYFTQHNPQRRRMPDVVLVDGLHTYEQAYRDVVNSVNILNENGVIVMHDCNPDSMPAAYPANSPEEVIAMNFPGWNRVWCGDVWKAIVRLRTEPDLEVFVLNTDFGLGIVRRKTGAQPELQISKREISDLTYEDLNSRRVELLNLKPVEYFNQFIGTVRP